MTTKDTATNVDAPAGAKAKKEQDAAAGDTAAVDNPTLQRPEDLALLDKAMTPNQPPPIESDVAAGQANELERQRRQAEAVRKANAEGLPTLGGNTWDTEAEAAEAEADKGKG